MIGVYSPYPSPKDYMRLLDTMLVVLRNAQEVSNSKTLANDPGRASAQKFTANCIMVTRNIVTSLNELYSDNDIQTRATMVHFSDKGWAVEFHKVDPEPRYSFSLWEESDD